MKPFLVGSAIVLACGVASLYAALVYEMLDEDPLSLTSCINVEAGWHAWTCKQVLRHAALSPERVRELNTVAGALYPVLIDDPEEAEAALMLFLARGVDINAANRRTKGWTALHIVMSDRPEKAAMLLRHGARTDIRDADGMTPLDRAYHLLRRFPGDPYLPQTIRLLESAERK